MRKKNIASLLVILVTTLLFTQCERKNIYNTPEDKPFSLLSYEMSSWLFYPSGIDVYVGTGHYAPGSTYNFGSVTVLTSGTINVTIRNTGDAVINVTGHTIGGTIFTTNLAAGSINPGGIVNFNITFNPVAVGTFGDTLTINSDDANRPVYNINLIGIGSPIPVPNIDVWIGTVNHTQSYIYDFNNVMVLSSSTVTLTIRNTGNAVLNIINSTMSGTMFTTDLVNQSINPGGSVDFHITFTPVSSIGYTGVLRIESNDPDEGTYYNILLQGAGTPIPVPDINLQIEGVDIASGNGCGFASVDFGSSGAPVDFTIQNLGTGDLNLTGSPIVEITGTNAGAFSVSGPGTSSIPESAPDEPFTVTFTPSFVGPHTATLRIYSDDPDSVEQPYIIDLNGTGTGIPDIFVQVGGTEVPYGTTYDFIERLIEDAGTGVTFTIENKGSGDLTLTGSPYVELSGVNAGDVTITQPATNTIGPGLFETFTVDFKPSAEGERFATIQIPSSDPDSFEQPYVIDLKVTGIMPVMVVHGNNSSYTSVYDPTQNKFNPGNPVSGSVTSGGHSFPAQYMANKWRVVLHGGGQPTTSRYDPISQTFTPGPPAITGIDLGTHSFMVTGGTNAGKTMIICGSTSPSVIMYYNPGTNNFSDSFLSLNIPAADGSFSLPNMAGNTLIVTANNSPYYQIFNQGLNTLGSTMIIDSNAYVMNGAHAFQIPIGNVNAGLWLIIQGPGNSGGDLTWLYDPSTTSFAPGPTLTAYAAGGAFSIPIIDGSNAGMALIVHGNGFFTTSLYHTNGSISPGPDFSAGTCPIYAGAFAFRIPGGVHKGKFMIIHGNFQRFTTIFDPETLAFEIDDLSDDLPLSGVPAAWGAHAFPAR